MSVSGYVKDRGGVYLLFGMAVGFLVLFMRLSGMQTTMICFSAGLPVLVMVGAEIWEYRRRSRFYRRVLRSLTELDRKYLLPELLETPDHYEGRLLCDVLRETNRSMYEHVAAYRNSAAEFREFIELWVHEIKLPVSSLLLMAHHDGTELNGKIREQLRRIDGYTDTVLYFARAENAEKDYLIKPVSLKRIVSDVAVRCREDLLLHGVEFRTEGLDLQVMTDGKWLAFMLGQLLANSLRYTAEGREAVITVSGEKAADRTVLHFRDNGIGIPPQDLPNIFARSFTGENGRTHAKSTGMGLYIVKNLCDRLGHGISVTSVQGEYTEFCITFADHDFYRF